MICRGRRIVDELLQFIDSPVRYKNYSVQERKSVIAQVTVMLAATLLERVHERNTSETEPLDADQQTCLVSLVMDVMYGKRTDSPKHRMGSGSGRAMRRGLIALEKFLSNTFKTRADELNVISRLLGKAARTSRADLDAALPESVRISKQHEFSARLLILACTSFCIAGFAHCAQ